jgi:uncharacterized protein YkwD
VGFRPSTQGRIVTTLTQLRHRPVVLVAVLVAALLVALVPAPEAARADAGREADFVAAVNRERAEAGLPTLAVAADLTAVARRHSARMADQGKMHHNPNLASDVGGWLKVGENVGRGPSVSSIHTALMNSSGHRRNILDGEWSQIGIGVEVRGSTVWMTAVFRLPAGAAPKAEPKAEPEPEAEPASAPKPSPESEPKAAAAAPTTAAAAPKATPANTAAGDPGPETTTAAAPAAEPAPEPAPDPEPHEVVETPLPLDRLVVTLARMETTEERVRLDRVLDRAEG